MGLEDLITWYQKKIGAYDKQQWEKTVEQHILHGLTNIQLKTAKLKAELIDVDLVRGSSFTKAKPKHGFLTVARLSTVHILLLPLYSKWWVQQTSGKVFVVLLSIYILELINLAIYSFNSSSKTDREPISLSEITVPIMMMWILSFIHSQIVSTSPGPEGIPSKIRYRRMRRSRAHKAEKQKSEQQRRENLNVRVNDLPLDDDGFESLNGNNSGPSDIGEELAKRNENETIRREWGQEVRRCSAPDIKFGGYESDSDRSAELTKRNSGERRSSNIILLKMRVESTCDTDEEGECEPEPVTPKKIINSSLIPTPSSTEWISVTTASEGCSYSSEHSESDTQLENFDLDAPPNSILSPYCGPSDRVSCTIWDRREIKKADLSVIEISSAIIARVETLPESMDYFYIGLLISTTIALLPLICRFCNVAIDLSNEDELQLTLLQISNLVIGKLSTEPLHIIFNALFGTDLWERSVIIIAAIQRWVLATILFFLLAVAERTYKQRFLYAKLFSHLTSSRRARKSDLPHFRLNKVRNIKTWLLVRSYLKKRGPQRSIDVIVSAAVIITLLLLSFLCLELLKETFVLNSQYNLEILIWSTGLGILILRFMTLGIKINKKYRNLSVLITEQINLYLQIEEEPHKKEELMLANSILKLAADLLKELEGQSKIVGLSANPVLYNITKVVILSALSGVLSEVLGFKLKLHKIKLK